MLKFAQYQMQFTASKAKQSNTKQYYTDFDLQINVKVFKVKFENVRLVQHHHQYGVRTHAHIAKVVECIVANRP